MKSLKMMLPALAIAAAVIATSAPAMAGKPGGGGGTYKVIAWNDLGMHCACPTFSGFLLLPPFNTIRAQVLSYGTNDPVMVT